VLFEELLARQVANGSAIQMATTLEIDAVIDPADTRHWLAQGLASARTETSAPSRFIDTW
jgi:acetyl-CoA carboxylase carboxyltransferase component